MQNDLIKTMLQKFRNFEFIEARKLNLSECNPYMKMNGVSFLGTKDLKYQKLHIFLI